MIPISNGTSGQTLGRNGHRAADSLATAPRELHRGAFSLSQPLSPFCPQRVSDAEAVRFGPHAIQTRSTPSRRAANPRIFDLTSRPHCAENFKNDSFIKWTTHRTPPRSIFMNSVVPTSGSRNSTAKPAQSRRRRSRLGVRHLPTLFPGAPADQLRALAIAESECLLRSGCHSLRTAAYALRLPPSTLWAWCKAAKAASVKPQ